jgi:hypothetical protein
MTDLAALAAAHAAATWFLAGLIWFVQVVHYPLFDHADPARYPLFQAEHENRTTRVVAPAMLTELATAIALTAFGWTELPRGMLVAGLGLLGLVWIATAGLAVPRHRALRAGFDGAAHRALVATNWIRTIAWTARGAIALALLLRAAA